MKKESGKQRATHVLIGSAYGWVSSNNHRENYVGSVAPNLIRRILISNSSKLCNAKLVEGWLSHQKNCFSVILENNNMLFAAIDHIRGFPVFYYQDESNFFLSNDARLISTKIAREPDRMSEYEFLMSGYVHENRTLYKDLKQLCAGHYLIYDKTSNSLKIYQWKELFNPNNAYGSYADCAQLGDVLDDVFQRLATRLKGRPVWVPLSGGLDSRLVLCKLIQHGVKQLRAFTHGVRGSHEFVKAKEISEHLGISWHAVPSRHFKLNNIFASESRRNYAEYADGLSCVPVYLDYEAILKLKDSGKFENDAVVVNGYSGDFIFGGHIPQGLLFSPTLESLVSSIISKHCSLFSEEINSDLRGLLEERLALQFAEKADALNEASICALLEQWDWQERQCKAVINGQRVYEYFELDWEVPLWDLNLVELCQNMPLHLRLNQNLHIEYLREYNYRNVFDTLRSVNQVWPRGWGSIRWLGRIIGLVRNEAAKKRFFNQMFYFSYFRNQLGLFGWNMFLDYYDRTNRPHVVPLAAMSRLKEVYGDTGQSVLNDHLSGATRSMQETS